MQDDGEFSPLRALMTLWRYRLSVVACALTGAGLGALLAYTSTLQYRAEVLVAPNVDREGGLAGLAGQLGGLASFAGIQLGSKEIEKDIAIARLTSRALLEEFVTSNGLMPVLFAHRWDAPQQQWKPSMLRSDPGMDDAVDLLRRRVIRVNEDRRTGLITIAVTWRDREAAASWANELVVRANDASRTEAIGEAQRSRAYLQEELRKTDVIELRESINRLIEAQLKSEMMASVRVDHALRVIDVARAPEPDSFVKPRRAVLVAFGTFVGLGLGVLLALIRNAVGMRRAD